MIIDISPKFYSAFSPPYDLEAKLKSYYSFSSYLDIWYPDSYGFLIDCVGV